MTGVAPARPRRTPLITATTWIDLGVLVALIVIAVLGFEPAFGRTGYLLAALGGLVVGGGVAITGWMLRLPVIATVALAIVGFFAFGTPLALPGQATFGVLPSLDSLSGLVLGAVFGWSDAVTLHAPLEAPPYVAVVPYVATWLVGLVTVSLVLRWFPRKPRSVLRSSLLVIAPVLLMLASILLGTREPFFASVRGVAFAALALLWLGWRRPTRPATDSGLKRRKVVGSAIVVAGAVLVGALAGSALAPAPDSRFVVRDAVTPPFDPLDYPAPLAGFRHYTKDLEKTKLFTVRGLREGERIRLATMDSYNGVVWSVTGPDQQTDGSGSFQLLGSTIPSPSLFTPGARSKATITVSDYDDVWLPTLGYMDRLHFDDYRGDDPAGSVRVNTMTGTTAVTSGVDSGLSYTIGVTAQKFPTDKQLKDVAPATIEMPPVTNIPDIVSAKATEYAGSATTAIQKLRNIERSLKKLGYLSHGRASDPVPSRAGEGADRMTDLFATSPMVGDQEQYASAFALMARRLGYPARVVMGFEPENKKASGTVTFTGNDVTAWAEVAFDGVGWVPFFPTPDKTDAPKNQTTKPKLEPQPQVRQPPQTNPKSDELLTPVKTKENNPKDKKEAWALPTWAIVVMAVVGVPVLLYLIAFLLIAALKRRRSSRRENTGPPDRRAAGAWDELVDRYAELGLSVPERATRLQTAAALDEQSRQQGLPLPDGGFTPIADRVDEAVFAGADASDETVSALWSAIRGAVSAAQATAGWLRRQLIAFRFHRRAKPTKATAKAKTRAGRRTRPAAAGEL
jgi:transglutaminase-like putative cysteine protease